MVHKVEIEEVNAYEPKLFPFQFHGSSNQFFQKWLLNGLLTISTLGVFSAWASIKHRHYFYAQTQLANSSFEYHALPQALLKGRAIAAAFLFALLSLCYINLYIGLGFFILSLAAIPFVVVQLARFHHKHTTFRNIRFHFSGHEKGAALAYLLWPFLSIITLGLLIPFAHHRIHQFYFNNSSFGNVPLKSEASVLDYYKYYLLLFIPVVATFSGMVAFLPMPALEQMTSISLNPFESEFAITISSFYAFALLTSFLFYVFVNSVTTNLILNSISLDNYLFFRSRLSFWKMFIKLFSGTCITLFTVGIAYPWAKIPLTKYRAESIAIQASGSIDTFVTKHVTPVEPTENEKEIEIGI